MESLFNGCCEPLFEFMYQEGLARNPYAIALIIIVVFGGILFFYVDSTVPDASSNGTLNFILLIILVVIAILGYSMYRRYQQRMSQTSRNGAYSTFDLPSRSDDTENTEL